MAAFICLKIPAQGIKIVDRVWEATEY